MNDVAALAWANVDQDEAERIETLVTRAIYDLLTERKRLRATLERIRDWRGFRHTGEVRDCAGEALRD